MPTTTARRSAKTLTVDDLITAGGILLGQIVALETQRTDSYRKLAETLITLRQRFQSPKHEGLVDWTGRSMDYRAAVAKMYERAGVPPDSVSGMQAAIRYHVGNVLREVAPAEELKTLGLLKESPQERARRPQPSEALQESETAIKDLLSGRAPPDGLEPAALIRHATTCVEAAQRLEMPADPGPLLGELERLARHALLWIQQLDRRRLPRGTDLVDAPAQPEPAVG